MELAAAIAVFIAVSALLGWLLARPRGASFEQRLGALAKRAASREEIDASGVLRREGTTLPVLRRLSGGAWADRAAIDLQQAGLTLRVSEYLLIRAVAAAVVAIAALFIVGGSGMALLLAAAAGVVGFWLPALYVLFLRNRRINTINSQMVEGLQLISNALRSGFAFTQAVEMAAKQLDPPLGDEFTRYLQDSALGQHTDAALEALVQRTGSVDVEMMATTLIVQRTTGGNLSEILDNVAETIRERERLQGEIRALTAQQRLAGLILSIYPLFLVAAFTALMPSLMKTLWTEEVGRVLLVMAVVLQVAGIVTIRRILRLDV